MFSFVSLKVITHVVYVYILYIFYVSYSVLFGRFTRITDDRVDSTIMYNSTCLDEFL